MLEHVYAHVRVKVLKFILNVSSFEYANVIAVNSIAEECFFRLYLEFFSKDTEKKTFLLQNNHGLGVVYVIIA